MSASATATRPASTALRLEPGRRRSPRVVDIIGVIALVLLLLSAGWLALFSSVLAVRQVIVTGARDLSAAQVRDVAAVPIGRPLLRLDLDAIARRTAQIPQVASAEVIRDWPRTVTVRVVERRPVLAVQQPGGYLMVDRSGLAYEMRGSIPSGVVNAQVNPDNRSLLTEVGVVSTALPAGLRKRVQRVSAISTDGITLTLDSGVVVVWGNSTDSALKAQLTATLLRRDPKISIDVSSPHDPAVR